MKIPKILLVLLTVCSGLTPIGAYADNKTCVILLHGLGRTHYSMLKLESVLKLHHYIVVNQDYPSTKKNIDELATEYIPPMVDECLKYQPATINFVTHSLGGIVLQKYLQHHSIPKLGPIVMLAPPNHGSPLADLLHDNWLFRTIAGPAGQELTTSKDSTPNQLQLTHHKKVDIGIITGKYSITPFAYHIFHEENDGIVAVSSAQITNMKDFILLPVMHSFIMNNDLVDQEILHFFKYKKFMHL